MHPFLFVVSNIRILSLIIIGGEETSGSVLLVLATAESAAHSARGSYVGFGGAVTVSYNGSAADLSGKQTHGPLQ